jgi:hypothetical protein
LQELPNARRVQFQDVRGSDRRRSAGSVPVFADNSLRFIINRHWGAIASETQHQITFLFPFYDPEEANKSSLFHTIVKCGSSLFTVVVLLDLIESLFGHWPMLMFTSALFSEIIVSVYSQSLAPVRPRDVHHFLRQRGVGFATALVIGPLFECKVGTKCSLSSRILWRTSTGSRRRYSRFFFSNRMLIIAMR